MDLPVYLVVVVEVALTVEVDQERWIYGAMEQRKAALIVDLPL